MRIIEMKKKNDIYNSKQVESHKEIAKNIGYEYIHTYEKGEMMKNGKESKECSMICVKCPYCKSYWVTRLDTLKKSSVRKHCPNCCGSYEKSLAYYIEIELNLNIDDVWDYELNKENGINLNPHFVHRASEKKAYFKCPKGIHESELRMIGNFTKGHGCKICGTIKAGKNHRYSYEYVKNYIENEGYKLLSDKYEGTHLHLLVQCDKNHKSYPVSFSNFKHGYRCPYCKTSKGEKKIINFFDKNEINYIFDEPYFNDLIGLGGKLLRPDFLLPDYKIWIEYDGEFHYKKYYEKDGHEKIIIHDKIKDKYAKENDWKLIRIPYWEFDNIEEILLDIINNK